MTHRERILAAIRHEKTDKVPKGELGIAPQLVEKLTGKPGDDIDNVLEAANILHMDILDYWCAGSEETLLEVLPDGSRITKDRWNVVHKHTDVTSEIIKPAIEDVEDCLSVEFPDVSIYARGIETIRHMKQSSDLFILAQPEGVLTPATFLLGFENTMMYTCTDPDIMAKLCWRLAEHYAELACRLIDAGADGILIGDDVAYNTGTYISPDKMREIVFPALKNEVKLIRVYSPDTPIFFHSDGDLRNIMDDIIDCGYDAIQSLQPTANMDIAWLKEKYGDKICLMGNIDINTILPFGTEEEVRRTVRETMEIGSRNSGYILSTCNILTRDLPLTNVLAMYDEAEKFKPSRV